MGRILLIIIILLVPFVIHAADDPFVKLKELTRKAKEIEGVYLSEEEKLKSIDAEVSKTQQRTMKVRGSIETKQKQISEYDKKMNAYENNLDKARKNMRLEWITLYKSASLDMVSIYYSHEKYSGYLNAVMKHHMRLLQEYQMLQDGLVETRKKANDLALLLKKDLRELEETAKDLETERMRKAELISSLKTRSKMYQDQVEGLLKEIQRREKLKKEQEQKEREKRERQRLEKLKKEKKPKQREKKEKVQEQILGGGDFFVNRGKLVWPLKGRIIRGFGPFTLHGILQKSQGIDIETWDGAPVKSIFAGTVVFSNWIEKYGNTIILDHGDGYYSVYGHLQDTIKSAGQKVSSQEVIARVGQSGSVLKPTLHFEIRFHQKAMDPVLWLIQE